MPTLGTSTVNPQDQPSVPPRLRPEALAMLARVGGPRLVLELRSLFLSYAPARLQEASEAAARGDADGVGRACHALRSGAAQLGLAALAARCLDAEGDGLAPAGLPAMVREVQQAHDEGIAWLARQLDSLEAA